MKRVHVSCDHCATPFVPKNEGDRFCCSGCEYVFKLINEGGFDQFYDLQGGAALRPVEGLAFEQRDYSWLVPLVAKAESDTGEGTNAKLELSVAGVSCAACVWLIERLFAQQDGAAIATTDVTRGSVDLSWQSGALDLPEFARTLQSFGYELGPPGAQTGENPALLTKRLGLCAAFAMNAMAFTLPRYLGMPADFSLGGLFELVAAASAALAMAVGGSYFISRAARALSRGVIHIDLPIALGVVAAFGGSMLGWIAGYQPLLYFDFVAIFIFLMLGGRWLQERTLARSRGRLLDRQGVPDTFLPEDGSAPAPLSGIGAGTRFRIRPGELVPVASTVDKEAPFGLGWISGEAEAPPVPAGGVAPSGSMYLGASEAILTAREGWDDSLLRRLTANASPSETSDPRLMRIIAGYIIVIIALGIAGASWWLWHTGDAGRALQVAVSLFVVSCPCALGVALPLAERIAAAAAARHGAYPRKVGFWARLVRVRKAVFDKTGTLTLGRPALRSTDSIDSLTPDALSALAQLTADSPHPVSRALAEELAARSISPGEFNDLVVEETPGRGVSMAGWSLQRDDRELADAVLLNNGQSIAHFEFQDDLRSGAGEEVARLRNAGIDVYLMSGDRTDKVQAIAKELDIPDARWRARMSPDEKAAWVREIDARDTLYLGDGANDSIAFDAALCTATPATEVGLLQDKADLFFLGRGLGWLGAILPIARQRRAALRSVIAFAVIYNIAAAALALSGNMNPLLAAVLMPLSSAATVGIVTGHFRQRSSGASKYQLKEAPISPLLQCGVEQSGSSSGS